MLKAVIDFNRCLSSIKCQDKKCLAGKVCPTRAFFKLDLEEPAVVEINRCNGCGDCLKECPVKAILIREL